MCFVFFKHETAYELRISDWSSDVCSSDLDGSGMTTRRALFWLGSATLGALGGFLLGQMTIGEGLYGKLTGAGGAASYAEYSSNPSAATVDRLSPSLPCRNCPDSYAAAAHARAARLEAKRDDYQDRKSTRLNSSH